MALPNPAAAGSISPNETRTPDGRVLLSWLEPTNDGLALRFAIGDAQQWSPPQTVVSRDNFDRYAEAPPWVLQLPDRTLLAVWPEQLPKGKSKWAGNYLYTSASADLGKSWSLPMTVHTDQGHGEHSFASISVRDDSHATVIWLDSRDYETKHTYRLMSAVIASSGAVSDEETVDDDVCTCCPTGLVKTATGLLATYRNHTSNEIRDIYTVREEGGKWLAGKSLKNDGWHINGCPVNGAAVADRQNEVAIAWYSGIEKDATVEVAFSRDGGATFPVIRKIDAASGDAQPLGRPTIALLGAEDALVAWVRHVGGTSQLVAARVRTGNTELQQVELFQGATDSLGYPRMQVIGSEALVSWGGAGEAKGVSTAMVSFK